MNQASKQIAFDPASQRLYLSVPNSGALGNTVAVLDPATDTIVGQQYAGSNPNVLTISGDSRFLYAGIDGASTVQRFLLPSLTPDIFYPLGLSSFGSGPFFARDLQVAPGAPHTTAVTMAIPGSSPEALGGVAVFDDATARPTIAKGFGPGGGGGVLYDSIQWGADATSLFAANSENSGFDFYTLSVNSSGVSLTGDFPNTFSSWYNKIHFDPATHIVYSDDGHVVDPTTGKATGTFSLTGLVSPVMVPDSSLNLAFFATQTGSNAIAIYSYNLSTFAPVDSDPFVRCQREPASPHTLGTKRLGVQHRYRADHSGRRKFRPLERKTRSRETDGRGARPGSARARIERKSLEFPIVGPEIGKKGSAHAVTYCPANCLTKAPRTCRNNDVQLAYSQWSTPSNAQGLEPS